MPTPRSRLAVLAYGGRVYAIAGDGSEGISGAVEVFLPATNDWVRGADKPIPVANVGAVALGGKIYVPGGSLTSGSPSDQLEIYDPHAGELGTWTTGKSLPQGVYGYAIATHKDKLYLFGGWDGRSNVADSYVYDPEQDVWSPLSPMPTSRAFSGAGEVDDLIYVVGGYDGKHELDTCEVYDPAKDAWDGCPSMSMPRGGVGVVAISNRLYVVGGGWENYLVENEFLSSSQETWDAFPSPLLQEWRNLGVAADETYLYAIGGWNGGFSGANYAYRAMFRLYLPSALGHSGGESTE